jgi:chromosome partitioning protein
MRTVALLNKKGGVGKTTLTANLGGTLAGAGRRVLLVDLDPQANLTAGLLGPAEARALPAGRTVAAVFDEDGPEPRPEHLVRPTAVPGLTLLAGSQHLDRHNQPEPELPGWRCTVLRELLAELRDDYDVVLCDCPPTIYRASWAALTAADAVVVPLQPEDYGSMGVVAIQEALAEVQAGRNPGLHLAGYLLSMHDKRLVVHQSYELQLRALYGADVFTAAIPLNKDFKLAAAERTPLPQFKPRSAAAKAVKAVADELLVRIGLVEPAGGAGKEAA